MKLPSNYACVTGTNRYSPFLCHTPAGRINFRGGLEPPQPWTTLKADNMRYKVRLLLLFFYSVQANLEGPFLFFGSKSLEKYKRPALTYLDQDELMRIYGEEEAIVVFNNQDSVPLSSGYFPRLRKMLEGQTTLVLPQDFLDVHPDYISNETQVCAFNFYVSR